MDVKPNFEIDNMVVNQETFNNIPVIQQDLFVDSDNYFYPDSKTNLTDNIDNAKDNCDNQQEEIESLLENKNTLRSNCWAFNSFTSWISAQNKHVPKNDDDNRIPNADVMSDDEVVKYVSMFIMSVRKKNGSEYTRTSLQQLIVRLQMYYRTVFNRRFDFFTSGCTTGVSKVLDAKMKQLSGTDVRSRSTLTQVEIETLWLKGVLGDSSSLALINTVFLYNSLVFGFRGGIEHRKLQLEQFKIEDHGDSLHLTYSPRIPKMLPGDLYRKKLNLNVQTFTTEKGLDRCIISMYQLYFDTINETTGAFYRRPSDHCRHGQIKFEKGRVIGKNTLNNMFKAICSAGGFDGKYSSRGGTKNVGQTNVVRKHAANDDSMNDTQNKVFRMEPNDAPCCSHTLAIPHNQSRSFNESSGSPVIRYSGFAGMFQGAPPGLFANATVNFIINSHVDG